MAYCKNCGKEVIDVNAYCPHCGAAPQSTPQNTPAAQDKGGFLWGLLGCCVPIAGLVLFLIWKDTKPKTSKAAGIGALVSVIAGVVISILYFVLIFAVGLGMGYMGY